MKDYAIRTYKLTKTINKRLILSDINLNIEKGKIYGILAPNGAGKSMLFKLLSGLMEATSGQIYVWGKEVGRNGRTATNTGILIEHPGLIQNYSAYKNLKLLADISKRQISPSDICDALSAVGLQKDDTRPVKKYSLGMRQKLGIAQALLGYPDLLLLDEPSNNLDLNSAQRVQNVLLELNKTKGTTIVFTSHQREDFVALKPQIIRMENGKLL